MDTPLSDTLHEVNHGKTSISDETDPPPPFPSLQGRSAGFGRANWRPRAVAGRRERPTQAAAGRASPSDSHIKSSVSKDHAENSVINRIMAKKVASLATGDPTVTSLSMEPK